MAAASKDLISTGDIDVQFLVDAEDSGGSTTAFITRVGAGGRTPPPHSHPGWDETVYCTSGTLTFTIDGVKQELATGEALCIRRGQVHQFENLTDRDAHMLVVSTPGLFGEDYFVSVAEILNAGGPPDMGALLGVMASHGVEPSIPAP